MRKRTFRIAFNFAAFFIWQAASQAQWTHTGNFVGIINCSAASGPNLFAGTWGGVWKKPIAEMLTSVEEPVSDHTLASSFFVSQNYPNPFNPETIIGHRIPMQDRVKIIVYNLNGDQVALLKDASENAGDHSVKWDGKNAGNQTVSAGIYLCGIQAGKYRRAIRMLFLK